jgi:hypothetical protein
MSHENLIVTLASNGTPVTPLPAPGVRMMRWVVFALAVVGVGIAWRGLRVNWAMAFADPTFVLTTVLIGAVALGSAWATFALSVPGRLQSGVVKWLPIAGLVAWGAAVLRQAADAGGVASALALEPMVTGCMWKTYGLAVGPAFVILLLARRAAPLDWRWTGGLAALSALAFGVIGTELICPISRHAHLFNWHYLPVAAMTAVAFALGSVWGRRA